MYAVLIRKEIDFRLEAEGFGELKSEPEADADRALPVYFLILCSGQVLYDLLHPEFSPELIETQIKIRKDRFESGIGEYRTYGSSHPSGSSFSASLHDQVWYLPFVLAPDTIEKLARCIYLQLFRLNQAFFDIRP